MSAPGASSRPSRPVRFDPSWTQYGNGHATARMNTEEDSHEPGPLAAMCVTCGGFQKISNPRLYQIQFDERLTIGMTMGEWKMCPRCGGSGRLPLRAPV